MNRRNIAAGLRHQIAALETHIEHLRSISDGIEKVSRGLDIRPISKSREEISKLTLDIRWLLPPKIVSVGEALDRMVEEDMRPNMDRMTNSTGNKRNYW